MATLERARELEELLAGLEREILASEAEQAEVGVKTRLAEEALRRGAPPRRVRSAAALTSACARQRSS